MVRVYGVFEGDLSIGYSVLNYRDSIFVPLNVVPNARPINGMGSILDFTWDNIKFLAIF